MSFEVTQLTPHLCAPSLTWDSVLYASNYQVLRSSGGGPFVIVGAPVSNSFLDTALNSDTTYVYRVRAADVFAAGPLSGADIATTMFFTDDPISAGQTTIKAAHILELRKAVNAVRAAAALAPVEFTDGGLTAGWQIKAAHVEELRLNLDEARSVLGLGPVAIPSGTLITGSTIKAAHVRELRAGVK